MSNTLELSENQTSLKSQRQFGLDVLLISTSLMLINGVDQNEANRKLAEKQKTKYRGGSCPMGSGIDFLGLNYTPNPYRTTIDLYFPTFTFTNTTFANDFEGELDGDDFAIKPKFNKEFKVRVASLRIDKSLPKIFAD